MDSTNPKKPSSYQRYLLPALGGIYLVYMAYLGTMTGVHHARSLQLSTDTERLRSETDAIYIRNAALPQFVENEAFLASLSIPSFATYLEDLNLRIPEGTRTQNIRINRLSVQEGERYELSLTLETLPPLREMGRVIDSLESGPYFENVRIAGASIQSSPDGQTTISYPITMTLILAPDEDTQAQ